MSGVIRKVILLVILVAIAIVWVYIMSPETPDTIDPTGADLAQGRFQATAHVDQKSDFPTIHVFVLVQDMETDEPVLTLSKEAFAVVKDATPVPILQDFVPAGGPVSAALVLDTSGSMGDSDKLLGAQAAASEFVAMTRAGKDYVAVLAFSEEVDTVFHLAEVDPVGRDSLQLEIANLTPAGPTAFYQGVYAGIEEVQKGPGRKTVIALTDGINTVEEPTLSEVITRAVELDIPVFTIGLGTGEDIDTDALRTLAEQTGGKFYQTPDADELAGLYASLVETLQNEYVLSFICRDCSYDGKRHDVGGSIRIGRENAVFGVGFVPPGVIDPKFSLPLFATLLPLLLALMLLPNGVRWVGDQFKLMATESGSSEPVSQERQQIVTAPSSQTSVAVRTPSPVQYPAGGNGSTRLFLRLPIRGDNLILGSDGSCDLVVPASGVSARHARIARDGERYVIEDQSHGRMTVSFGGNPAQLRPSTRNALKDGSLLGMGPVRLFFRQPVGRDPWLEMVYSISRPVAAVGSASDNTIVLSEPTVSPHHAELRHQGDRWVVHDLGSAEGTFVSYSGDPSQERRVSQNALKTGSTVRFGPVKLVFVDQ